MPTIEERALALVNEVKGCEKWETVKVHDLVPAEALFASIETLDAERAARAAFRQEVSDVARDAVAMLDEMAKPLLMGRNVKERLEKARSGLAPLIIPKPVDPLVEVIAEANDAGGETVAQWSGDFLAALAKRGGRIVFEEVGDAD